MQKINSLNPMQIISMLEEDSYTGPLPNPDDISYYILEKERKLYLDFDVDEDLLAIQRMILRWNIEDKGKPAEERKPIWLYIMSYGGQLDYMFMLIDTIEMSSTPVYTVDIGQCASAAALIFMAGKKRFMCKSATVLIHEGSATMGGDAIKVQDQADNYKKALKQMKDFILAHTHIPKAQLMKRRANDWELDAAYCLENGVCDAVISNIEEII